MSKIAHRKFWSGTLREERCGIIVISTKLLIVNYQIKKKTFVTFLSKQPIGWNTTNQMSWCTPRKSSSLTELAHSTPELKKNYNLLKNEKNRIEQNEKCTIVPLGIGSLGEATKGLNRRLRKLAFIYNILLIINNI